MKKTYIAILTAAAGLCSCIEMMDSASQADVVNPLNVSFKVKAVTGFVDADGNGTINTDFPVDGLTVRFTNFEEDAVIETLRPIREEATRILADKAYLESVYRAGAQKASYVAEKTLRKVYKKVGFVAR